MTVVATSDRADGLWAHQLAVVVDDAALGVTDVVRGEDLSGFDRAPDAVWRLQFEPLPASNMAELATSHPALGGAPRASSSKRLSQIIKWISEPVAVSFNDPAPARPQDRGIGPQGAPRLARGHSRSRQETEIDGHQNHCRESRQPRLRR
jgi:hypothetical protein